ncbi:MAG: protein tyrosine phosphatase [Rhizobiales bacterium 24-66-13]|nr:MAG: protein tyrosine phosphatase [Rhizobiales bacterium 12-66-7]OYZ82982.1 MAG: protein tyrosine phosphatase [Rhizobiales bacterium 24-66-13]OZB12229.1 MAG: protein tyrosine phosphatase [Rhizobiales bacterium 39-66-18]
MPYPRVLKATTRRVAIGVLTCVALGAAYLGAIQLTGNFATVVPHEVYRSAQPTPKLISEYVAAHGIRTIINLRGANMGNAWYDAEISEAHRLNVTHLDFRMSARRELSLPEVRALIHLMETAEKPILIHCQAGSDRTGLASALYLAAIKKADEAEAEGQLSIRYGHFSLPFIPEYAMDRTFEAMEPELGFHSHNQELALSKSHARPFDH